MRCWRSRSGGSPASGAGYTTPTFSPGGSTFITPLPTGTRDAPLYHPRMTERPTFGRPAVASFLAGLLLTLVALSLAGRWASRHDHFERFERFHNLINPEG